MMIFMMGPPKKLPKQGAKLPLKVPVILAT